MALKNIPVTHLEAALSKLKLIRQDAAEKAKRLEAKQKSIAKQLDEAHRQLSDHDRDIKALKKALELLPGLTGHGPAEAQGRSLADMKREAADEDITVRRSRELNQSIAAATAKLQGNCTHAIVVAVPGDWEELPRIGCIKPELLACPFCGLYEENRGRGGVHLGKGDGRTHICVSSARMDRWRKENAAGDPEKSMAIFWDLDRLPAVLKRLLGK